MTYENPDLPVTARIAALNSRYNGHDTAEMLADLLADQPFGPLAMVSSFGAESVVLLHMVAQIDPALPVIFLDTEMLFPQTLAYQRQLAATLGLRDIRRITPDRIETLRRDPDNLLHRYDQNACCTLRKSEPLERALAGFGGWISGRKRFQGGQRRALGLLEADTKQRIKINPLAHWGKAEISAYMAAHDLPRHPLVAQGYPSVGCMPCTTPASATEDPRAGRWRGAQKTECGIHTGPPKPATVPATVIVSDEGFAEDDWQFGFHTPAEIATLPEAEKAALALDLANDTDAATLLPWLDQIDLIRVEFPVFSDGRGFSLAQRLRANGYHGRLRAKGHVLADQYAMLRRSGFDEAEISPDLAARQSEQQWQARADWQAYDYQRRFRQTA